MLYNLIKIFYYNNFVILNNRTSDTPSPSQRNSHEGALIISNVNVNKYFRIHNLSHFTALKCNGI
jgi:predicted extracellular nuclease